VTAASPGTSSGTPPATAPPATAPHATAPGATAPDATAPDATATGAAPGTVDATLDEQLSTQPVEPRPPALTPLELLRWAWRQLTSMRIALILLFLLALAAIPGSLVPQRSVDPLKVSEFAKEHPGLTRLYEKLSLFEVFSSPWFSAIYLLLFISLLGCVVPRTRLHARAMRARPPQAPRNLSRLPSSRRWETSADPETTLAAARTVLRSSRFRVDRAEGAVSAEKGYLRETGNLVFHVALIGVLVAVALGNLYGFSGSVLVVEGRGFANTLPQYDEFEPGRLFDAGTLPPFSFKLTDFTAAYQESGSQRGAASSFDAAVDYRPDPDAPARRVHVKVNKPLVVDGAKIFLTGHGYAPVLTVKDGRGDVVYSGPTPFLPQNANFASVGVAKAPDARPEQLGLQGFFLPTATADHTGGLVSIFPGPKNPAVILRAWTGDLGLDDGTASSVYRLETDKLTRVTENGKPVTAVLQAGKTMTLPDGLGTVTYEGYREWAAFQIAHDPGKELALGSAALALAGLVLSLFVRRRRVWVRAAPGAGGRTVVEIGGLARTEAADLDDEIESIAERLRRTAPEEPATDSAEPAEGGPAETAESKKE
jgi:cytochrome c biogenesis protein